jgi:hypothetical protein
MGMAYNAEAPDVLPGAGAFLLQKSWRMMDCKKLTLSREGLLRDKALHVHLFVVDAGIIWTIRG